MKKYVVIFALFTVAMLCASGAVAGDFEDLITYGHRKYSAQDNNFKRAGQTLLEKWQKVLGGDEANARAIFNEMISDEAVGAFDFAKLGRAVKRYRSNLAKANSELDLYSVAIQEDGKISEYAALINTYVSGDSFRWRDSKEGSLRSYLASETGKNIKIIGGGITLFAMLIASIAVSFFLGCFFLAIARVAEVSGRAFFVGWAILTLFALLVFFNIFIPNVV